MATRKKAIAAKRVARKTVTLTVVGGDTFELELNNGPTLGEVLKDGMPKSWRKDGSEVRVNNRIEPDDYRVEDKDVISVVPRVAGGR